jgi:indole-3-glycerol phosphate synthase
MPNLTGITTTHTILDKIIAHKIDEVARARQKTPLASLQSELQAAPPVCNFVRALQKPTVTLIAEVKKASPSKGVFLPDFEPVAIAREYHEHGASALSVLTDERFFQGSLAYLQAIRQVIPLPILRKEFIIDPYQVVEARVAGADAVLLIAACLDSARLHALYQAVIELGMTALIEVHDATEMERVLALNPQVIGVNNRNLHDFRVDLQTTVHLAAMCPPEVVLVGESGIHHAADVEALAQARVHAVLVGESLVLAEDRPAKIRELSSVSRAK